MPSIVLKKVEYRYIGFLAGLAGQSPKHSLNVRLMISSGAIILHSTSRVKYNNFSGDPLGVVRRGGPWNWSVVEVHGTGP